MKAETECRHSRAVRSGSHNQIDKQRRGSNNNDRGKSCMERKRKIGRGKALLSGHSESREGGGGTATGSAQHQELEGFLW